MTRTTIGLFLIYALLLIYWKNLSDLKLLPTSTLTIFSIHVTQHIVQVTAQKQPIQNVFSDLFLSPKKGNISVLAMLVQICPMWTYVF